MSDIAPSAGQRPLQGWAGGWTRLWAASLRVPFGRNLRRTGPTWEIFSKRFDRSFRRVSLYVSRRVSDRKTLEHVVTLVLVENLELFLGQHDERQELKRFKASADRLLAVEVSGLQAGSGGSALAAPLRFASEASMVAANRS